MLIARRVELVGGLASVGYALGATLILLFVPFVPVHFVSGTSDHVEVLSRFQALGGLSGVYYEWPKEAILLAIALVLAAVVARSARKDSRMRSGYARVALWVATAGLSAIIVAAFFFPAYVIPFLLPSAIFAFMASIAAGFMVRPQV